MDRPIAQENFIEEIESLNLIWVQISILERKLALLIYARAFEEEFHTLGETSVSESEQPATYKTCFEATKKLSLIELIKHLT